MDTTLDEESPRARLALLLKHFSELEDGRLAWRADSDEVTRAFRDDVARCSDMMSPGVRCLAG